MATPDKRTLALDELEALNIIFRESGPTHEKYVHGQLIEHLFTNLGVGAHFQAIHNLACIHGCIENPPGTATETWRPTEASIKRKDEYLADLAEAHGQQAEDIVLTASDSELSESKPKRTKAAAAS
jgi:hypothetical protein